MRMTALLPPFPNEVVLRTLSTLEVNRIRPRLNPRTLGPMTSMITTTPPWPTTAKVINHIISLWFFKIPENVNLFKGNEVQQHVLEKIKVIFSYPLTPPPPKTFILYVGCLTNKPLHPFLSSHSASYSIHSYVLSSFCVKFSLTSSSIFISFSTSGAFSFTFRSKPQSQNVSIRSYCFRQNSLAECLSLNYA
jgi:hypothetical protein